MNQRLLVNIYIVKLNFYNTFTFLSLNAKFVKKQTSINL